jgi:hypothetical protein
MDQFRESQNNMMKIRQARQKMEFDQEDQEFERKKREMELEDGKRKGLMSELQYDIVREQQKAFNKQQDEISKGTLAQIKVAEHQQKTTADEAMNWAKIGYRSDPQGVTNFLTAYKKNQDRQSMIVPEFSYGKVGYTTKDIDQPKPGYDRKDVISQANKMAEIGPRGSKPADFMQEAEALLKGDQPVDMAQGEVVDRPVRGQSQPETFKPVVGLKDDQGNPVPVWKQQKMFNERQLTPRGSDIGTRTNLPNGGGDALGNMTRMDNGYGNRPDGTPKGSGYFGELKMRDGSGSVATELTAGVNIDGKETDIPLLVPTLTEKEKNYLLEGNKPTREIIGKAVSHAKKRMSDGKSPYADGPTSKFKPGDIRTKNGVQYKRNGNGEWLPVR